MVGPNGVELPKSKSLSLSDGARHGWPGVVTYWFLDVIAIFAAVGATGTLGLGLFMGVSALVNRDSSFPLFAVVALIFPLVIVAVLAFVLSRGLKRFRPWARVVLLGLSCFLGVGGVSAIVAGLLNGRPPVFNTIYTGISFVFIRYFHQAAPLFERGADVLGQTAVRDIAPSERSQRRSTLWTVVGYAVLGFLALAFLLFFMLISMPG